MCKKILSYMLVVSLMLVVSFGISTVAFTGEQVILEVVSFEGGYGIEWLKKVGEKFERLHPDVKVDVWGNPRVWDQLQPRFVAGNPPDVCAPGWKFDVWGAIYEERIKSLNDALGSKAFDKNIPWKSTFLTGILENGKYKGKYYYIPLFVTEYGWWYNKTVWDKYGWEPPATWNGAYKLFDKMRGRGIEPIANQGMYPMYIEWTYLPLFIARIGGERVLENCFNLEPEAWTNPAVVKAVTFLRKIIKDYFQKGHLGMNHLQSQAEVMVGHAGVIACGNWYPKEQEQIWPEGTEVRCMNIPIFTDSKFTQAVQGRETDIATNFVVPADAKHVKLAVEFLKLLTSEDMMELITEDTGAVLTYGDSLKWIADDKLGRAVRSCSELAKGAKLFYAVRESIEFWYPSLAQEIWDQIATLAEGKITPEEFCKEVEKKAQKVRKNPDWPVHLYEMAHAGE